MLHHVKATNFDTGLRINQEQKKQDANKQPPTPTIGNNINNKRSIKPIHWLKLPISSTGTEFNQLLRTLELPIPKGNESVQSTRNNRSHHQQPKYEQPANHNDISSFPISSTGQRDLSKSTVRHVRETDHHAAQLSKGNLFATTRASLFGFFPLSQK